MSLSKDFTIGPFLPLLPPRSQDTIKRPGYGCTMPLQDVMDQFNPKSHAPKTKTAFYCTQINTALDKHGKPESIGAISYLSNFQPDGDTKEAIAAQGNPTIANDFLLIASAATLYDKDLRRSSGIHWVSVAPETMHYLNTMPTTAEMSAQVDSSRRAREAWGSDEAGNSPSVRSVLYTFDEARKIFLGAKPVTLITCNRTKYFENGEPKEEPLILSLHNDHDPKRWDAVNEVTQSTNLEAPEESLMALRTALKKKTELLDRGRIYPEISMEVFGDLMNDPEIRQRARYG